LKGLCKGDSTSITSPASSFKDLPLVNNGPFIAPLILALEDDEVVEVEISILDVTSKEDFGFLKIDKLWIDMT